MIKAKIYIEKYDWWVSAYIAVTHYDSDEILLKLWQLGCSGFNLKDARSNLYTNAKNTGLTYSSYKDRQSVLVTAIANNAEQQFNTFTHEVCHVCCHIANANNIDKNEEDFAYLVGDLSMALFPKVKHLLCDCCREKHNSYEE